MLTPVAPPLYTKVICFVCLDTRMVSGWDHEISPGTMRILTMRPQDPLVVGGGGGAKTFTMRTSHGTMRNLTVRPWDFSWYHEMFSWWNFLPPPPTRGSHGLMVRLLMVPWDISWSHHEISHGHHVVSHGQIVAAGSSCRIQNRGGERGECFWQTGQDVQLYLHRKSRILENLLLKYVVLIPYFTYYFPIENMVKKSSC